MPRNGIFSFFYCWSSTTTLQICSLFSSLSLKKFQFEIFEISDFPLFLCDAMSCFFLWVVRESQSRRAFSYKFVCGEWESFHLEYSEIEMNILSFSAHCCTVCTLDNSEKQTQRWHSFSRNHQTRSQWVFTSIHETLKASKITLSKHSSVDNAYTNNWIHLMSSCCASQLENSQNKISFTHNAVCLRNILPK